MAGIEYRSEKEWKPALRLLGLVVSVVGAAAAIYAARISYRDDHAWWLLGAAFVLAVLWQNGLVLRVAPAPARVTAPGWPRAILGGVLTAGGVALWTWAPYALFQDWSVNFDHAWLAWLGGTVVLSLGVELLWGRWEPAPEANRSWRRWTWLLIIGLLAVSAVYRLGNLASFPGEGHVTQVEELQNGSFGQAWLDGGRGRWEWLTQTWTTAAGIWFGGPTLLAIRRAYGVASMVKIIPVFFWLSYTVGGLGAVVGTALLTCSSWDVIFARIGQPNEIFAALTFALLAAIARRGRPATYVWLGFVGGYLLYEYIAYRPLILFILIGATVFSLRDTATRWPLRLVRPLIVVAMIVSMGLPLFLSRISGRVQVEYFDGLNRARGYGEYYNPGDSWQRAVQKRLGRAVGAVSLFYFHGDPNATHNIGGRPVIDSVTAVLLLFGAAYGLTHFRRSVVGLTVVAFVLTLAGTLVLTGNWDIARAANTMVYPYVLAGYGAAAVGAVIEAAWRRSGRRVTVVVLAAAVAASAYLNTSFLLDFWSSPTVRAATQQNLALLTSWLRSHVHPGEHVVVIAPGCPHVLIPNDASWLRGGQIPGVAVLDVGTAVGHLAADPGPTLLVVFAGTPTASVQKYLERLVPGLHMEFEPDLDKRDGDIAYAHLQGAPPELAARVEAARCLGIAGEYELLDSAGASLAHVTGVAPFIDYTTWSSEMGRLMERLQTVAQIRMRFHANVRIDTPGPYTFTQEGNAAQVTVVIDGQRRMGGFTAHLDAGLHALEVEGRFRGFESAQLRLLWRGPDTHDRLEVMPMYRLAETDATCAGRETATVSRTSLVQESSGEE